jgi:lycopene cyclase domain-containing protein
MIAFSYLGFLLFSIFGLAVLDHRFKLAFWYDAARTAKVLTMAIALFIIWDIIGIKAGIFMHGNGPYSLPFRLFPEFPIEELFFLFLLTYVTLLLYRGVHVWRRIS